MMYATTRNQEPLKASEAQIIRKLDLVYLWFDSVFHTQP
jgi:hypothetical protein